jgi:hypothetical protein
LPGRSRFTHALPLHHGVLHALIQKSIACSLLNPIDVRAIPFRTSMYADDLVLFLSPIATDLQMAKVIFDIFRGVSGLGCNVQKNQMVPISYNGEEIAVAQSIFPC